MMPRPWPLLSSLAATPSLSLALALALAAPAACTHSEAKADRTTPAAAMQPGSVSGKTAASASTPEPQPVPDETSGCATANDCAFTQVAAGACCPLLCSPRVVTKARAAELSKNIPVCNNGRECPLPPCRPPVADFRIVCEQQRCAMKITPITSEAR